MTFTPGRRRLGRELPELRSVPRTSVLEDPEAEKAYLGYLIQHAEAAAASPATRDHFSSPDRRDMFQHVVMLAQSRGTVDSVVLSSLLRAAGTRDAAWLVETTTDAAGVDPGALFGILEENLRRRRLDALAHHLQKVAFRYDGNLGHEIAELQPQFDAVLTPSAGTDIRLVDDAQLVAESDIDYLVDGLIPSRSISLLVGASGCGKTFLAIGLSLSIASGQPWHGRSVRRGTVIYLAAEGRAGVRQRVEAWKLRRCLSAEPLGVLFMDQPIDLTSGTGIAALRSLLRTLPKLPILLVIDTWSVVLALGEGQENDAGDVNRALTQLRRLVRDLGLTVLLVHHEGHASPGRARGSSALRAGVDAELTATSNDSGVIIVANSKQRDAAAAAPIALRRCVVDLGENRSSCVLEDAPLPDRRKERLTGDAQDAIALRVLADATTPLTYGDWQRASGPAWLKEIRKKLSESTFNRTRKRIVAAGLAEQDNAGNYAVSLKGRQYLHHHQTGAGGESDSDHKPPSLPSPPSQRGEGARDGDCDTRSIAASVATETT